MRRTFNQILARPYTPREAAQIAREFLINSGVTMKA